MKDLPRGKYEEKMFKYPKQCSICLTYFKNRDDITFLPCDARHHFHFACVKEWLSQSARCPICNKQLSKETIKSSKNFSQNVAILKQNYDDKL